MAQSNPFPEDPLRPVGPGTSRIKHTAHGNFFHSIYTAFFAVRQGVIHFSGGFPSLLPAFCPKNKSDISSFIVQDAKKAKKRKKCFTTLAD
ncbi:hypothetical protein MR626_07930 [bacterium]|nr:hypothetical protein [bacterium]